MNATRAIPSKAIVIGGLSLAIASTSWFGCFGRAALAIEDLVLGEEETQEISADAPTGDLANTPLAEIEIVTEDDAIELVPVGTSLEAQADSTEQSAAQQNQLDLSSIEVIGAESGESRIAATSEEAINRVSPWEGVGYREHVNGVTAVSKPLTDGRWIDFEDGSKGYKRNEELTYGWAVIANAEYYFDENGHMLTGWQSLKSDQGVLREYYLRPSGSVATGWCKIDGQMHYFKPDGSMVQGWLTIADDKTSEERHYYFNEMGVMLTGWQDIEGCRLYFRESGSLAIGWADVDGVGKCYFDHFGSMVAGWQTIDGHMYHFTDNGAMQIGAAEVDDAAYIFSNNGVLVM